MKCNFKIISLLGLLSCFYCSNQQLNAQVVLDTISRSEAHLFKGASYILETLADENHTLVINEIMAANESINMDENGDYDDWFEVYNYGSKALTLNDYYFSDNKNKPSKWKLSDDSIITIQPNEHIIFWADDEEDQGTRHTNFNLSRDGETLYIFLDDETIVDTLSFSDQSHDISYGRYPDGSLNLHHFTEPTPALTNSSQTIEGILEIPTVDIDGGSFDQALSVSLSSNDIGSEIYYTLDYSEPTINSNLYSQPIPISKTTVLRAKAIKDDFADSPTLTKTYIFTELYYENPILNIVASNDDLYGSQGILDGASSIEIPAHMEYIVEGKIVYNSGLGIKLHSPKSNKQYSMRLYSRSMYGNNWFEYPFFDNLEIDKFKRLIIRNSGNDCVQLKTSNTHFRDQIVHSIASSTTKNAITSNCNPVNVFINGEFFGVYNMRERIDEYFVETHFPDIENYDLLERCFGEPVNKNAIYGTWDKWNALISYIDTEVDLSNDTVYNEISSLIDIENFTDYWLTEVFVGNYDWLSNNIKFIVPEIEKCQWIYWDLDHSLGYQYASFGEADWNTLEWSLTFSDRAWSSGYNNRLVRNLLMNEQYKTYFIKRLSYLMNVLYNTTNILPKIDSVQEVYSNDMNHHALAWGNDINTWPDNITILKDYFADRPFYVFKHMTDFFSLFNPKQLSIKTLPEGENPGQIIFDNNKEQLSEFNGMVYPNYSYNIEVTANYPWEFVGWEGIDSNEPIINQAFTQDTTLKAIFKINYENPKIPTLFLNEVYFNSSNKHSCGDWLEFQNISNENIDLYGYKVFQNDLLIFEFTEHITIDSFSYFILAENKTNFENVYFNNAKIYGELLSELYTDSELLLIDNNNNTIQLLNYNMGLNNWPTLTQNGFSYELTEYTFNVNNATFWLSSKNKYGTPGMANGQQINFNRPTSTNKSIILPNEPEYNITNNYFEYNDIDGHKFAGLIITDIRGEAKFLHNNQTCINDTIDQLGSFSVTNPNKNNTITIVDYKMIDISGEESLGNTLTIYGPDDVLAYDPELELFPNPASDILHINMEGYSGSTMNIKVYSMEGYLISEFINQRADQPYAYNLNELNAGEYIILVRYNNRNIVEKFIKL